MTRFTAQQIPYSRTGAFSALVSHYIENAPALQPFYDHATNMDGVKNAILQRRQFPTNRAVLVHQLRVQYAGMSMSGKLEANMERLLDENTFTITTAHQPNIFTGHLYFIYKILHVIKLSEEFGVHMPDCHFVPVYYMGSEDADLEELGQVTLEGKKYVWETKQKGAVGRMKIDQAFIKLIDAIEAQMYLAPHAQEMMMMIRGAYSLGKTVEQATFELVHELFKSYGLVVLLPDNAVLKNEFSPLIIKDLKEQFSHKAVAQTVEVFPAEYKVQASGREINLFYLKDDVRERIECINGEYQVLHTDIRFDEAGIFEEISRHPERFSPNVILRPLFQEMILPNILFIGGGGELAYWLELKKVFEAASVPYPMLVLRNSFMVIDQKRASKIQSLQMDAVDFFSPTHEVVLKLVRQSSKLKLELAEEKKSLEKLYQQIKSVAAAVDVTLEIHTDALFKKANKKVEQLERKMLLAEKKKFEAQQRQIEQVKAVLFPSGGLQERVDNVIPYYASYGKSFIELLYEHSLGLQQQFTIITEMA